MIIDVVSVILVSSKVELWAQTLVVFWSFARPSLLIIISSDVYRCLRHWSVEYQLLMGDNLHQRRLGCKVAADAKVCFLATKPRSVSCSIKIWYLVSGRVYHYTHVVESTAVVSGPCFMLVNAGPWNKPTWLGSREMRGLCSVGCVP